MIRKILDPYKVFISLLIAIAFWITPFGADREPIPMEERYTAIDEFSLYPKLIQAIVPEVSAACAPSCMEDVCLKWVPIGGSCQPDNPWDIGCCTRYGSQCNEDLPGCGPEEPPPPPPPTYSPPTVSGVVTCSNTGPSGWCINNGNVVINASDPQGYAVTISGYIAGNGLTTPFSCASPCTVPMSLGHGSANYTGTAAISGLSSAAGSAIFAYDPSGPVITQSTSGDWNGSWHYTAGGYVTISASDPVSGLLSLTVTQNGSAVGPYFPIIEGINNITMIALDRAGNQSITAYVIQQDSVKPQVTFTNTGVLNGAWYSNATVSVSASDATSGLQSLIITDNGSAQSSPIALSDGAHTIRATANDFAGNVQTSTLNIQVDGTPPIITPTFSGTSGSNGWYTSNVAVSAFASDAGSGTTPLKVSIDGGAFQNYTAPFSLSDGLHTVQFQVTDIAGNSTALFKPMKIDTTLPQMLGNLTGTAGDNGWYISDVTVKATSTDATSGIASEKYRLDGGAWQNGSSITVSQDGDHTVEFLAIDNAGNQKTINQVFKIDQTPPQITLTPTGDSGSNGWYVSSVSLEMLSNDTTSGLSSAEYDLDETSWKPLENSVTLTDGWRSILARSKDKAGNTTTASILIKVDTVPPAQALVLDGITGSNNWYVSDVLADVSTSDATSANVITTIADNGGDASFDPITLTEGIHTLHYTAVDEAGNSVSASDVVSVDTTIPTNILSSPFPNSVAIDTVQVGGQSADLTSGLSTNQISFDNLNWLSLPNTIPDWLYGWETADLPNGSLSIFARSIDQAGNTGIPSQINVVLDNHPPFLELSNSWNIWESGILSVEPNVTPLESVRIVVHDAFQRYPDEVIYFDLPAPEVVTWDRVIGPGNAPPGSYLVDVEVCDIYSLCSKATATIIIPEGDLIPAAEPFIFPPRITQPPVLAPTQIVIPIQLPQAVVIPPVLEPVAVPPPQPVWTAALVTMLLFMFAILLLLDPRPTALRSLAKTIYPIIRS